MIYIDNKNKTFPCFFCKVKNKQVCDCKKLRVSIEEVNNNISISYKNKIISRKREGLKEYNEFKKQLLHKIKEGFPKKLKIVAYPYTPNDLKMFA